MRISDTSTWIGYFNGANSPDVQRLDQLLTSEVVTIGDIIYCEILQGFRIDKEYNAAKAVLDQLHKVPMLGFDIAAKASANYRYLLKQGVTVRKTIDMIIATFCIENGAELLHNDRDFIYIAKHLPLKFVPIP